MNLSAPRLLTFALSFALIGLAVASMYLKIPTVGKFVAGHRTEFFVGAYAVLALGVLSRRL
ncbi:hypothetical protein [Enterovirga sp.]|uniref:hypothetical protein n=1 Tax=Enterovirga sp. TaxID=2026350 RepID=UPI002CB7A3D0|nr:hypothetical protein [Enterovirga sp.]HMO30213.1 hypothetical protein [Enterovirga sp.]